MNLGELLILPTEASIGSVGNYYETTELATSDCNEFIPVSSLNSHNLLRFENDIVVIEYSIPTFSDVISTGMQESISFVARSYEEVIFSLKDGPVPNCFTTRVGDEVRQVGAFRGTLLDYASKEILLCLTIDPEYLLSTPIADIISSPVHSKFRLLVSHSFSTDLSYKNLYRKVKMNYIDHFKTLGIDILETADIKQKAFKNNFEAPSFRTARQLRTHLSEIPGILIEQ